MLNLGPDKMIVIFVLALVLLGPEKLPGAARRLGELMRVARHYSDGFRQEMNAMVEHVTGLDSPDPDRNSRSARGWLPRWQWWRRCRSSWSLGLQEVVVAGDGWCGALEAAEALPDGDDCRGGRFLGASGFDGDDRRVEGPGGERPADPAISAGAGMLRCRSSTSIRARVPSRSPSRRRASTQNRSCMGPKGAGAGQGGGAREGAGLDI